MSLTALDILSQNDKRFAKALCDKISYAIKEFQEIYSDELYYIASRFCNRGTIESSWKYRTKKGYDIHVSDNVADAYLWLAKQVMIKSCLYKEESSFEAYIKTVLNSNYTFKDWLKFKTDSSLIKKTGTVGYVPACMKKLGEPFIEVFKQLRYNKSDDFICKKLDLDINDYYEYYDKVEKVLIESGQIDLLRKPIVESTDASMQESEEFPKRQLTSEIEANPSIIPDFVEIKSLIELLLDNLTKPERKVLNLWAIGYSVNDIMDTLTTNSFLNNIIDELKIVESSKIYALIEKIISKCVKYVDKNHPSKQAEYLLDNRKMKKVLKIFYNNF